jgi:AraC-like DNA-binding protein
MHDEASTSEVKDLMIERLFTGPLVKIHRYRCLVSGRGPSEERSHPWHAIAMPHRGLFRLHLGKDSLIVEPNSILYWNPVPYRSSHPLGSGDAGTGFIVPPDILIEAIAPYDPGVVDRRERLFAFPAAPSSPLAFMAARLLLLQLAPGGVLDDLAIDESALQLVGDTATRPYILRGITPRGASSGTSPQRDLVEAAKSTLFERFSERLHLSDVAQAVAISPFTLCRAFRRETHLSIHQYLNRLRLRAALEMIATSTNSLIRIALDVGFSSHSHFTSAFHREFRLTPRDFRRASLGGSAWRSAWTLVNDPGSWQQESS